MIHAKDATPRSQHDSVLATSLFKSAQVVQDERQVTPAGQRTGIIGPEGIDPLPERVTVCVARDGIATCPVRGVTDAISLS